MSFSSVLIVLNAISVKIFGTFEYWFSTIKISAIVGFIILRVYVVFGSGNPDYGVHNYTAHGGFFPNGSEGHVGRGDRLDLQLPEHRDDRGGRR